MKNYLQRVLPLLLAFSLSISLFVPAAALTADANEPAQALSDGVYMLLDPVTGMALYRTDSDTLGARSPDGSELFTVCSTDGGFLLSDQESGKALSDRATFTANGSVLSLTCSAGGKVSVASADGSALTRSGDRILFADTDDADSTLWQLLAVDTSSADAKQTDASGSEGQAEQSGSSIYFPSARSAASSTVYAWGIDVSKHQGTVNWTSVANSGVDFAIIRIGYGSSNSASITIDSQFYTNLNGALNAGLDVGLYLYSYAINAASATSEANQVVSIIKNYPGKITYPIFMDIEDSVQASAGKTNNTAAIRAFVSTVKSAGYYCGYYSYLSFINNYFNKSQLTDIDLWIAAYGANDGLPHSSVLSGFTSNTYQMWQYTSRGASKVSGISSSGLDLNYAYVNYPSIIKSGGYNGFSNVPQDDGKSTYFTACPSYCTTITEGLNAIGVNSSYSYRAQIAAYNNFTNYTGTPEQNTTMLNMLKAGTLLRPVTSYTVTFNGNGGSVTASSKTMASGSSVNSDSGVSATRTGYTFLGWSAANDNTVDSSLTVTGNMTVYACWSIKSYTVTFNGNGGSSSTTSKALAYGVNVNSSGVTATRIGYTFLGWSAANDNTVDSSLTVTGALAVYACWSVNNYTVTFNGNGGTPSADAKTMSYLSVVNTDSGISATRTGYTFLGWSAANDNTVDSSLKVTADMTVYACWSTNAYTVTFDGNGGTPSSATLSLEYGTDVLNAGVSASRTNYTFLGWSAANDGTADSSIPVTADMTVYAVWQAGTHTITYLSDGVSETQRAVIGSSITFPTRTKNGYAFGGWLCLADGILYLPGETFVPSGDVTFVAQWTEQRTQTVSLINEGETTKQTVEKNSAFTLPTLTRSGYSHDGWLCAQDGLFYAPGESVTVAQDLTFTALWTQREAPAQPIETTVGFARNLQLLNCIDFNVIVKADQLPAGATDFRMEIAREIDGTVGDYAEAALNTANTTSTRLYYCVPGMAAAWMTNEIHAKFYFTADGVEYVSQEYVTSIESYAVALLSVSGDTALNTLLVDMLNYGATAQTTFDVKTDTLANANLTEAQKALGTQQTPAMTNIAGSEGTGLNITNSVALSDNIRLAFILKSADVANAGIDIDQVVCKLTRADYGTTVEVDAYSVVNGNYYFYYDELATAQFGVAVTCAAFVGDEQISVSKTMSVESYLAVMTSYGSDIPNYDLYVNMMKYSNAAKAYFG